MTATRKRVMMRFTQRVSKLAYILRDYTRIRVFLKKETSVMKKYPLEDLVKRWEREDLTLEQAVGQILLWLLNLAERVTKLEINQRKTKRSQ